MLSIRRPAKDEIVLHSNTWKYRLRKMLATYFKRLIMKNKEFILEEILAVKGLMQLLMKQRNMNQEWTKEEIKEIKKHLKNISKVVPALLIFLLPGALSSFPFLRRCLIEERPRDPRFKIRS